MYKLFFDGSKTKDQIKYGIIIKNNDEVIYKTSGSLIDPKTTCNSAEYIALLIGLCCCRLLDIRDLEVYGDSAVVIQYMNKGLKKKANAASIFGPTIKKMASHFRTIEFVWIPRKLNREADREAK